MKLGRTSNLPKLNVPEWGGDVDLSAHELVEHIDNTYKEIPLTGMSKSRKAAMTRDGVLSKELRKGGPVSPRIQLAVLATLNSTPAVERPLMEVAAWGAARTGNPYENHPLVKHNQEKSGYPSYFRDDELRAELAQDALEGLSKAGLIQPGDRLLEIGAGSGEFAKAAQQAGHDVTALELQPMPEHQTIFPDMTYQSIEEHLKTNAVSYDIIVANHFSVSARPDAVGTRSSYFEAAADTLKSSGARAVAFGISTSNPEYLSGEMRENLRPELEKYFDVEYKSAVKHFPAQFEKNGSIGGMMGYLVCWPKGSLQSEASRSL